MHKQSIAELGAGLRAKRFSCVELTQHFLQRIQQYDPKLNALITTTADLALAEAGLADQRLSDNLEQPLFGIPILHKDIFCTAGVKTSCGSKMLDNFIAPYDAAVVSNLRVAGAICLGKTNMDEFAMGSSNEHSYYGPVRNPWNADCVPGGSSGGSAAAIAARFASGATSTDTGGSIRQPAALCGVTGIKPTYGLVSRFGMIAYASSLDQGGPMAASAFDCALLLQAMAGHDARDSTSVIRDVPNYTASLERPLNNLRIGIPEEFTGGGLRAEIGAILEATARQLEALGAQIKRIKLPNSHLSIPAYYVIAPAECSSNLARYDGVRYGYRCRDPKNLEDFYCRNRSEGFGAEVKRRILIGTYVLSAGYYDAYYIKAQKIRRLIAQDFATAFNEVDLILGPTTPDVAFKLNAKQSNPIEMYLNDIYTTSVNLAGLPGLSMPAGFVDDLPVGMQLIGNYFNEDLMLNVAHQFQRVTDWHQRVPANFAA